MPEFRIGEQGKASEDREGHRERGSVRQADRRSGPLTEEAVVDVSLLCGVRVAPADAEGAHHQGKGQDASEV